MRRTFAMLAAGAVLGAGILPFAGFRAVAPASASDRDRAKLFEKRLTPADAEAIERALQSAQRAGVDEREGRELVELCLGGNFTGVQVVRVLSLAAQLEIQGLPSETFRAKLGEGIAKRVDPAKVLQVAERRALHLNQARALLDGLLLDGLDRRDRDALIPDVAEALEAGMGSDAIGRIISSAIRDGEGVGGIRRKLFF